MDSILIFVLFLAPLVFFHELGHFLFARLFGVKVETFSIGFGPKLFSFKRGDTVYAFSLIPLGGYVKMFGDDPTSKDELTEDEKQVAFTHKSKWARFWIVFGGPLANFILAFFLYFVLSLAGENVPEPRLGEIPQSTIFHEQGLRSGDILVQINNQKISSFDDITGVEGAITKIIVNRADKNINLNVRMEFASFLNEFPKMTGQLRAPIVTSQDAKLYYISSKENEASSFTLEQLGESNAKTLYLLNIKNTEEQDYRKFEYDFAKTKSISINEDIFADLRAAKLYPVDLRVQSLVMDSAAESAEIAQGDIIIGIDDKPIHGFLALRSILSSMKENRSLKLSIVRGDKTITKNLTPKAQTVNGKKDFYIGIYSSLRGQPVKMVMTEGKGFFEGIALSWTRTVDGFWKTFSGFKKLILGEVSVKNLGGPIAIGKVATDSFYIGWTMFLRLMAIISINLGLINLFPIPVLDGGHIVFLGLEVINRGPLSQKKMQIAQQFGMSLLFLLIFVAIFNDISRLVG